MFYSSGIPVAITFVLAGIAVALLAGWRFYRQQASLGRGKIRKAGWDLSMVFGVVFAVSRDEATLLRYRMKHITNLGLDGSDRLRGTYRH